MSRYVLGVTISVHDAAAALVKDGRLVAAVEEERLVRRKHTGEFPLKAIEYCLSSQGIRYDDLTSVAYTQVPWMAIPRKLWYAATRLPASVQFLAKELYFYLLSTGKVWTWPDRLDDPLKRRTSRSPKHVFLAHHLTHAASAYLVSPFDEAALCSIDQRGEWTTTYFGVGRGGRMTRLSEIKYPDSLGRFYLAMTLYLGFNYHEEYEVMGLAAYGKPRYAAEMERMIRYSGRLRFRSDERFLFSRRWNEMYSDELVRLLGPPRRKGEELTERHCDIAASLQATTERIVFALLRDLHARTGLTRLCLAGGVALNSVMNGKIRDETPFEEVFIQPAAHDGGGSIGAAMYAAGAHHPLEHVYLGPGYSTDEIKAALDSAVLPYVELCDVPETAADLLARGKVIGWFQGRVEFGPRALGDRSILADPRSPEMKDRVNLLVKERQSFRPFAPAVPEDRVADYVTGVTSSPYMLLVAPVTERAKREIPAVVHVDGTARVQTVSRGTNERFYDLLQAFGRRTGVPVLLNTSFNLRGEPIVCSPRDALRTYFTSGLDALVIDRFLLTKDPELAAEIAQARTASGG